VAEAREAALPAALGPVSARGRVTSERALVRAAQGGSAGAMEEVFRRHWPRAHRAAWLVVHDAAAGEDVAQEAFLSAVRSLDRFDRRRPFGPWLHRIVVNRAIDYARAWEVRREVPADSVAEAAGPSSAPAEEPSVDVIAALAALAPEQRAVIVLRHLLATRRARSHGCSSCRGAR
jgi:RNA polymerase sigma-70 factor (ECF subfamily)